MESVVFEQIINTSVSLGVLAIVLFGLYRLTHRVIDVLSMHILRCCESLERIADAQERKYNPKP